jgi:hypothetical protein
MVEKGFHQTVCVSIFPIEIGLRRALMTSPAKTLLDTWQPFFPPYLFQFFGKNNLPASGDLGSFTSQPGTIWESPSLIRGNTTIEQTIYSNVASPGKQLGKLTDAVLAISSVLETSLKDSKSIAEIKAMSLKIEKLKAITQSNTEEDIRKYLEKLMHQISAERFLEILEEFRKNIKQ